jgi:excisionase family DNA binding protein
LGVNIPLPIQRKLEYSKRLLDILDSEIASHLDAKSDDVIRDEYKDLSSFRAVIEGRDVPGFAALICGDLLQNVRSTLDYLVAPGQAEKVRTVSPGGEGCSGKRKLIPSDGGGPPVLVRMSSELQTDVLTLDEAAELLRCHPVTVKRLAIKGAIPAKKLGSLWRFSRQRLMEWLQAN